MKKVFVTRKIFSEALERISSFAELAVWPEDFPVTHKALLAQAVQVDGMLTMLTDPIDAAVIQLGREHSLKVISQVAVGFDNIDINAATLASIPVGNTPGVLTETTADLAWTLMMTAARRVTEGFDEVRRGTWRPYALDTLCGADIYGATLGLVGFGRIGQAMAARACGFNMRVLYTQRSRDLEAEKKYNATYVSLEDLLKESDFISLHAYLSPETRGMIGAQQFAMMKPTAVFVNTARGAMIDSAALVAALQNGKLAAVGLDVFDPEPIPADSPLLKMPQVVITPHIGSASLQTRKRMASMAVENLEAGLAGKPLPHCANPAVYTSRK